MAAIGGYARQHWRRLSLYAVGGIAGLLIVIQLLLPWDRLPLYTMIDGVAVGGQTVAAATSTLNDKYRQLPVGLYFGNSPKAYRSPHPSDIGLTIDSAAQVDAKRYPLWLRLIPTSPWWAHAVLADSAPTYTHDTKKAGDYVRKQLGESCDVTPENASLTYRDSKLQVVPAIDGGTCKLPDVEQRLNSVRPTLASHTVRIAMDQHPAKIHDTTAAQLATKLTAMTKDLSLQAGEEMVAIPQGIFLSWLDFAAPDSGIVATVNADRSADFFAKQLAPKVAVKAGTSYITTLDFTVVDQQTGADGKVLDSDATIALLNKWLSGIDPILAAQVKPVAPTPEYTRTYTKSDTGLSALLAQFAESHPGRFGVSYVELSGDHRHAGYNDTQVFETASTYKLFVAYGTLKRIESGQWHWSDQIQGGRDLTKCFDDMIVKSDNACGEALLSKIGYTTLTNELKAVGLGSSSFIGNFIQSTAADEATLLGALQAGQLLSPASTDTLLSAMKRNIYRKGIPAGANGTVADKVGFLNGLFHDASIVYGPGGTYVLVVMTDGSSWGTIADLTRAIEAWRNQ